jgi:phosphomannomutase
VHDVLDDLAIAHGLHATDQLSVRVSDLSLIADAMARLRAHPPAEVAGLAVEAFDDLGDGVDGLPPTDGVRLTLAQSTRVIVRPSGTEPKLKCYLEVVVPVLADGAPGAADVEAARLVAAHRLTELRDGMAALLAL